MENYSIELKICVWPQNKLKNSPSASVQINLYNLDTI